MIYRAIASPKDVDIGNIGCIVPLAKEHDSVLSGFVYLDDEHTALINTNLALEIGQGVSIGGIVSAQQGKKQTVRVNELSITRAPRFKDCMITEVVND